jgi:hypothetical protein
LSGQFKQTPRAGYEYQDLIGIEELFHFCKNKDLYDWIELEYNKEKEDNFDGLDDVVCKIKGEDKYKIIQVKFTVDETENKCD